MELFNCLLGFLLANKLALCATCTVLDMATHQVLMAEKSLQMDTWSLPSLTLPTQLHLSKPYFWAVGISVPILHGPFLSDEQIPTSAHQTYHYHRNQHLNIQNDSTKLSIPVSTWNILNNLKINSKPITRRGSCGGIHKFLHLQQWYRPMEVQLNIMLQYVFGMPGLYEIIKTTTLNDYLIVHDVDVMCITCLGWMLIIQLSLENAHLELS